MPQLLSLGFVRADIFAASMRHLYEDDMLSQHYDHYFLYQHYPIDKENNRSKLLATCQRYGIKWVDSGFDRGLHNGFNYLVSVIPHCPRRIGFDPDDWPVEKGWDLALLSALDDPLVELTCLNNYRNMDTPGVEWDYRSINGINIAVPLNRPTMMAVGASKTDFFLRNGGMQEPTSHYGHVESWIWGRLQREGKQYAILTDYHQIYDVVPDHDPLYTKYKAEQAAMTNRQSFEEWLKCASIS